MSKVIRDSLALDRASIRRVDETSGHLHVTQTPISRANICPYFGWEVTDFKSLGLDRDKTYRLYRDAGELEKAAPTFDGKPLMVIHRGQTADDHDREVVVGAVSNVTWDAPYLRADLAVWDGEAIDLIENETQRELSCGYFYTADMTPGTLDGESYDGKMISISGNHVSLVNEGRAGPDCFVGDSLPSTLKGKPKMTLRLSAPSRRAVLAAGALHHYLLPKLAADAKVDLSPILKGVTAKTWKTSKPKIQIALDAAVKGKLAKDADIADVIQMLDQLDDVTDDLDDVPVTPDADPAAGKPPALDDDDAKLNAALKAAGLSDEQIAKICAAMKAAPAQDDDPADPADPAMDNDKDKDKDMVTKPAMDAAIAKAAQAATASALRTASEIRDAERAIRPYVGELAMSFDSAEGVYRQAFKMLKHDVDGVHPSALPKMLKLIPVPGARPNPKPAQAHDAAAAESFAKRFPQANRLAN